MTEINGTEGNDTLTGTANNDQINGLGGDDILEGGVGNDTLNGGDGNDLLSVNNFDEQNYSGNTLEGGAGNDALFSSTADASFVSGGDILNGGEGDDELHARGIGFDIRHQLNGGQGNDSLFHGENFSTLIGGEGSDNYVFTGPSSNVFSFYGGTIDNMASDNATTTDTIDLQGYDSSILQDLTWTLTDQGDLEITGTPEINSFGIAATLRIINYVEHPIDRIILADTTLDREDIARQILLSDANTIVDTDDASTVIEGTAGDDAIIANGSGRDIINGGDGNDTLFSSTTFENNNGDVLNGGAGDDVLFDQTPESFGSSLNGGEGNDSLHASNGRTRLSGGSGSDHYFFNLNDRAYGGLIIETTDTDLNNEDVLHLGEGITPDNVTFFRDGGDLHLHIGRTPREAATQAFAFAPLIISNYFSRLSTGNSTSSIETIIFADGTEWGQTEIEAASIGTFNHLIDIANGDVTIDVDPRFNSRVNELDFGATALEPEDLSFERDVDNQVLQIHVDRPEAPNGRATVTVLGFTGDEINFVHTAAILLDAASLRQLILDNGDGLDGFENSDDLITGGDNNDLIQGLTGDDTLNGGAGNDTLYAESEQSYANTSSDVTFNVVNGGEGDDILYTSHSTNSNDTLNGGAGNDVLFDNPAEGSNGATQLNGDAGDDRLVSLIGSFSLNGGEGSDTYELALDSVWEGGVINNFAADNETAADTLSIADFPPAAFTVSRNLEGDILLGVQGANPIVLQGFDTNPNNRVVFDDGTEWDVAELIRQSLLNATEGDDVLLGSAADEFIEGLDGNDLLSGGLGDDSLVGGLGRDTIDAGDGYDFLEGGQGNDFLVGGNGNDIYFFTPGDGNDAIDNTDTDFGFDVLRFAQGVTPDQVDISRSGEDLFVSLNTTGETITVLGHFDNSDDIDFGIDEIQFYDAPPFDRIVINSLALGASDGDDILLGDDLANAIAGFDGDDQINGQAGDDLLLGSAGDDFLAGGLGDDELQGGDDNDFLDGGSGEDSLTGGEGDDIYYFGPGSGNDLVDNTDFDQGYDAVRFSETVTPDQVVIARDLDDLVLTLNTTGESLRVIGHFAVVDYAELAIDELQFFDGTVLSRIDINSITLGATDGDDLLVGLDDQDLIAGFAGDDLIVGSRGNDVLRGDEGSDTYIYAAGDGNDVILNADSDGGQDVLRFEANVSPADVSLSLGENGLDLLVSVTQAGETQVITVVDSFVEDETFTLALDAIEFADGTLWDRQAIFSQLYNATEGADTIQGFDGFESVIEALGGDDVVIGGNSQEVIHAGSGNDQIIGSQGDDILIGGEGSDSYFYAAGDGNDTIDNSDTDNSSDVLVFDASISPDDVELSVGANGTDLLVTISQLGNSETITLVDNFVGETQINAIEFSGDATVWNRQAILTRVYNATEGDDVIQAFDGIAANIEALGGNDLVTGGTADDDIFGGTGDDTIDGGEGNDFLRGQDGSDVYRFSGDFGQDRINNQGGFFDQDAIEFTDISRQQIWLSQGGNNDLDLVINVAGTDNQVIVRDWYRSTNPLQVARINVEGLDLYLNDVQTLVDAMAASLSSANLTVSDIINNGIPSDIAASLAPLLSSLFQAEYNFEGADVLDGGDGDDVIESLAGNDRLRGQAGDDLLDGGADDDNLGGGLGNDTLIGGTGSDLLSGNDGNDLYLFEGDFGQDRINNQGPTFQQDDIEFVGISSEDLWLSQSSNGQDLIITIAGTDNQVTVRSWFSGRTVDEIIVGDLTLHATDAETLLAAHQATGLSAADIAANGVPAATLAALQPVINQVFVDSSDVNFRGVDIISSTDAAESINTFDGNDSIRSNGGNDTIDGGAGNDDIRSGSGDDLIIAGAGDDFLSGNDGNDIYRFSGDFGRDRVDNNSDFDDFDIAEFTDGIQANQLWFSQNNNDLEVNVLELNADGDYVTSDNTVVVRNWFGSEFRQLEAFDVDGQRLLNANVDQLVQALASFDIPQGAGQVISEQAHDALELAIASPNSWQTV